MGRSLLNRRGFLGTAGLSAMGLGLASLLQAEGLLTHENQAVSECNGVTKVNVAHQLGIP